MWTSAPGALAYQERCRVDPADDDGVVERRLAARVAGINVRPVVKEDAHLRIVPGNRRRMERRLAILVARADVGASGEQQFGDGRFPLRQRHRVEERCAPERRVSGVDVGTAREPGGDAGRVVGRDCFEEFLIGGGVAAEITLRRPMRVVLVDVHREQSFQARDSTFTRIQTRKRCISGRGQELRRIRGVLYTSCIRRE